MSIMKIELTETRLEKKTGFKFAYKVTEVTKKEIDERQYNNITSDDTLKWFRRLGGSETAQRGYTNRGYKVIKLISTSPNKEIKVIREFNFID